MTTELILLLGLSAFILLGGLLNNNSGMEATFKKAAPRLGARVEKYLETGSGFPDDWTDPVQAPSDDVTN
jgi:hypothetical protein